MLLSDGPQGIAGLHGVGTGGLLGLSGLFGLHRLLGLGGLLGSLRLHRLLSGVADQSGPGVVALIAVDGEILGGLVIGDYAVLHQGAVVAVGVVDVRLHNHSDDVAGDLIHGDDVRALFKGDIGGVPQISGEASLLLIVGVLAHIVVLLQLGSGAGLQLIVLRTLILEDVQDLFRVGDVLGDDISGGTDAAAHHGVVHGQGSGGGFDIAAVHAVLIGGQSGGGLGLAGGDLLKDHGVLSIKDLAVCGDLGAGVGHSLIDGVIIGHSVINDGVGGVLLGVDPAGEVGGAGADAAGLHQDGDGVIQAIVGTADGVVHGGAVVIDPQAGVNGVLVQTVHGLLSQLIDQRIVVQAAGGGGLHIIGVLHVAVFGDAVEGELVAVHDHLRHEVPVSGVQIGQFRGLEGHVVPVHIEALIGGAGEQIGAVGIDAGDDDHVDIIQHFLAIAAAQVGDHNQRTLARGGLIGMDLGLDPDRELAVGADQLASLLQRLGGGQISLGEHGDGHIILIGGGLAQAIQVHILFRLVLRRQIAHHLVLGGELMVGPVLGEEGGVIFLEILQRIGGEVLATEVVKAEPAGYVKEWNINKEAVTMGVKKL